MYPALNSAPLGNVGGKVLMRHIRHLTLKKAETYDHPTLGGPAPLV